MATPSSGGDSDKAIPQSLPPPLLMESWEPLLMESWDWLRPKVMDSQSSCSASDSRVLQQELLHGNRSDASDMSGRTDFSEASSFIGATSFNSDEVEEVGTRSEGRGEGEMVEGHLNSARCLKKGKRKVRSPRGERRNKKTTGARIEISSDGILQVEQMRLKEAARHLKGNRYDASDMSGPTDFSGATSFTGATSFNCATWSGATRHNESYGTTLGYGEVEEVQSVAPRHVEIDWATLGFDEVEEVETRREGRGEDEMEEGHLNSAGCLKKGKRKVRSPRGERGNKKTTGARIEISLDDILQVEQMRLHEAARHLKVSASTLKRVCREHGIHRWPPRMGKNCINQSGPSESLLAIDQERIAQQRPDTSTSDTSWSSNTNSVIIKARYVKDCTIRFRLSRPWVMVELEQQVQKRLKLEAGTFYIKYKDEDDDLIIIACDEDLQDYISCSIPRGTTSIEVLLVPK